MKTKERLAQALEEAGCVDLGRRARAGEFSDFESEHAMPKVELVRALRKVGSEAAIKLTEPVMSGEYDDSPEEAEAWYEGEGKKLFPLRGRNPAQRFSGEMRE